MHIHDASISGRSMRWYEWLLALMLLGLAGGVRADAVYKCVSVDGATAYQDAPCAPDRRATAVQLDPAPVHSPSPDYAVTPAPVHASRSREARRTLRSDNESISYECRASNGDVFYRHSSCPHTVPGTAAGAKSSAHSGTGNAQKLTVSARAVSRTEACAQIHRPGAIGRRGREHDDDVSTYDRNLGRDPCK
jgi:hypothetical protein